MKRYFITIMMLLIASLFTACGGASEATSSANKITVETKQTLINQQKNVLSLDFIVKNEYSNEITVDLKNLTVDVEPCVIKQVVMTPQEIIFSNEMRQQQVNALVEFDGACSPTAYQLLGVNSLGLDEESNTVEYNSPKITIEALAAQESNDSSMDGANAQNYQFYNVPAPITISQNSETYTFKVQLIDENSQGVSGEEVKILAYDITYGEIENMTAVTDQNGFASFNFTSPSSITALEGEHLTLTLVEGENFNTISTSVELNFNTTGSSSSNTSLYQFKNISSITVGHASEEKVITVDLVNSAGVGVAGKTVQISTLSSSFGSFSSASATTDSAGRASFTYRAPEDIDAVDGQSTTATLSFSEDDSSITATVSIKIQKSTDNTQGDTTLPTVVIPDELREFTLSTNSKTVEIPIKVFKDIAPYTQGSVKVELPSKVLNGVDVGSFSSFEVPLNAQGIATFYYTGPANLKALIDSGDTSSTFKFYHTENSDADSRQSMKINYAISADTYVPVDYTINISTQDNDFSMGIPDLQKTFSVLIKDTQGNIINDNDINITSIVVETENALIAQLFDTVTRTKVNNLTLRNENNSAFILISKQLSGIVPLKTTVSFIDINGESQTLSTIINVRVMSGPPSAISISYVSTSQDSERAKYEETFAVSVTDEYGNKVNTQPYISLGAIIGYTVDGTAPNSTETNETKRLFYGMESVQGGEADGFLNTLGDDIANTTNFEDNTAARDDVFKYVNAEGANTDKLVVFGSGKNYEAMGKWDFNKIDNHTLSLEDDYFGTDRTGLYYAVGHNYYQDQCRDDGREWLGSTDSASYQLDSEGTALITYKYDYHLTGKDALVWVNLNGFQADTGENTRIGEVVKHTLRGMGLTKIPTAGYSLDKGTTGYGTFDIWHSQAPEHYRNAHFGWRVKEGSTCQYSIVSSSNQYDARTCDNGESTQGDSYITFYLEAPADTGCTFDIEGLLVSSEF